MFIYIYHYGLKNVELYSEQNIIKLQDNNGVFYLSINQIKLNHRTIIKQSLIFQKVAGITKFENIIIHLRLIIASYCVKYKLSKGWGV